MDVRLTYRGRAITGPDVAFIRELIAAHPAASRRALSLKLCEAWNWVQPNGMPRDMVCRGLLLALQRAGHVELPRPRYHRPIPCARRNGRDPVDIDRTPVVGGLRTLQPLEFRQVRRTAQEPLFNRLLQQYHYLGYTQPVGEHLKYLVLRAAAHRLPGPLHRLVPRGPQEEHPVHRLQPSLPDSAVGGRSPSGLSPPGPHGPEAGAGLGTDLRTSGLVPGDLRGSSAIPGHVLPGGQLDLPGTNHGPGQG
jgi:hypothetical protein